MHKRWCLLCRVNQVGLAIILVVLIQLTKDSIVMNIEINMNRQDNLLPSVDTIGIGRKLG
ncbi:hypothetical protein [Oceanobacillus oncorhynchi]|uniref:hypothetical protein n=1 Tax=Oceanobacillus oncorhynchi TaxID=545501 RepID=UPI00299F8C10|nr:hypothetical protein [Oceanobacillus oncorhynchi]